MEERKFVVDEIIKGLECLDGKHDRLCGKCSFGRYCRDKEESIERNCRHVILNEAISIINQVKQEVVKDTVETIQAHLNMIFKALQNEKTEATVEKLIEINSKIAILESIQLVLGDLQKKYIGEQR